MKVDCINLHENPRCEHGPKLRFIKEINGKKISRYVCSAFRNLKKCNEMKNVEKLTDNKIIKNRISIIRTEVKEAKPEDRCYCHTCNIPFIKKDYLKHKLHTIQTELNDLFNYPTKIIKPFANDKEYAQYFFEDSSLLIFTSLIKNIQIRKLVCIGAPRLHEYITSLQDKNLSSFLLDLDERFEYFYDEKTFARFNMFNCYFFDGVLQRKMFETFLKVKDDQQILLFADPPYGGRTEPLIHTIKSISEIYRQVNNLKKILPIFWIYPYFMENYIVKYMPEIEMSDLKINYINHEKYRENSKGSIYGSPARLFTNIPLNQIDLSGIPGYKYCKKCLKWTTIENLHCNICMICPSKNGQRYRHCYFCNMCVKSNYFHCKICARCAQKENHICNIYQNNINCWICNRKGHLEKNCRDWFQYLKKKSKSLSNKLKKNKKYGKRICLICTGSSHNEKRCPKRDLLLKDWILKK